MCYINTKRLVNALNVDMKFKGESMRIDTIREFTNELDEITYEVNNLLQTVNDVKDTLEDIAERLQILSSCDLTEME